MFTRIQWRIATAIVTLILVTMAALGVFLAASVRAEQLAELESQLFRQATLVADDATGRLATQPDADLDALAKSLGHQISARVTLIARDGTVLGDSDEDPRKMENHAGRPEVVQALSVGRGQAQRHSTTLDRDLLYVAVPMERNSQILGVARVALPVRTVDEALNRIELGIGIATSVAAVVATLLALGLARVTTGPIENLTRMAQRLAAGDYEQRIAVTTRDELGQLARAFNQMAAELKADRDKLEAQRAELAAVLAGMGDGVVMVDDRLAVISLNPAAARLLEIDPETARGRSVAEVIRRHEVVGLLDGTGQPQGPVVVEVGPDQRQVQVVVTPLRVGTTVRQLVLFQDVTELRRAETIRRDFVANVSHELRTPLASLLALVETLEDGALDDPDAARDFLGRMRVEVERLMHLVEELLELARIESGRIQLHLRRADLRQVAREAAERLRPQAERQNLALVVDGPEEPIEALVDPDRLHQVVINLVHNAVKFTPPGGSIRVSVERREKQAALLVADTGIGVSAVDLPRLFERFYKVDRSRSSPGTGLGLAIVKHIVQAHRGRVWAESPGKDRGTTFVIVLPSAPVPPESKAQSNRPGSGGHSPSPTPGRSP